MITPYFKFPVTANHQLPQPLGNNNLLNPQNPPSFASLLTQAAAAKTQPNSDAGIASQVLGGLLGN